VSASAGGLRLREDVRKKGRLGWFLPGLGERRVERGSRVGREGRMERGGARKRCEKVGGDVEEQMGGTGRSEEVFTSRQFRVVENGRPIPAGSALWPKWWCVEGLLQGL